MYAKIDGVKPSFFLGGATMRIRFLGELAQLYGKSMDEITLDHPTSLSGVLEMLTQRQPEFSAYWSGDDLEDCILAMQGQKVCRAEDVLDNDCELILATPPNGG